MSMRTKETLFNAAIYTTGHSPSDQTGIWQAMEANYDEIVRAAFEDSKSSLPFGKGWETLTSRADGRFGYDDAFTYGADVLHINKVYLDDRSAEDLLEPWELDAGTRELMINANDRTIKIDYVKSGVEHTWSANFALAIQRELEAVIKNVLEETEEAELKSSQASLKLMKAGSKGSGNRSKRRVWKRGGGRILRARAAPRNGRS